jgi:hypothetical protein
MKKFFFFLLLTCFFSINSFAQNNDDMKKWMDYMTPGKEHQDLAKMNGDWVYTSKFWMDPNAPAQTSEGTAYCEMLLGGRYQQMTVSGKMMGMDFKGIAVTGFDNAKKVWVSSWIDNFGTGLMYMEGTFDDASKKIVFTGKMVDPMSGKLTDVKQTLKMVDDKNVEMEMFDNSRGSEFKNMEIKYTKK